MNHVFINGNGKLLMLMLVVLSFVASILSHNLAAPLYAKTAEKGSNDPNSSSYPPITPTSSGSSDNGGNIQPQHHGVANDQYHSSGSSDNGGNIQPQHRGANNQHHHEHSSDYAGNSGDHHTTSSNNNQQHKHHSDGSGNSDSSNGSSDSSDNSDNSDDANNNAIIEITK